MVTQAPPLQQIVEEDHRLEAQASSSARALMKHRWHWTMDESNPQRMSLRSYAELVGKHFTVIHEYAKGYAVLADGDVGGTPYTPTEALHRSRMGTETRAATDAVAQAHGRSFGTVDQEYRPEVRRVREIARQRAEERGTTVADEAPQVAQILAKVEHAEQRQQEQRQERLGLRYIEIENKLDKMRRLGLEAVRLSEGLDFEQDQRELLAHTIDNVRRLLEMMDRAIVGNYSPDWGEALRVIEGGRAS